MVFYSEFLTVEFKVLIFISMQYPIPVLEGIDIRMIASLKMESIRFEMKVGSCHSSKSSEKSIY